MSFSAAFFKPQFQLLELGCFHRISLKIKILQIFIDSCLLEIYHAIVCANLMLNNGMNLVNLLILRENCIKFKYLGKDSETKFKI